MKIHFLGTGTSQGIPVIGSDHPVCLSTDPKDKRLRVSVWIEIEDISIVIDCGPDFRQQMLRSGCKKIDAILFTHEHSDHTAGLDDIRPYYFVQGNIPIYGHQRVIESLKSRFQYIFEEENRYPGAPEVVINEITNNDFHIKGLKITPINAWHGNLQVFGFRIGNFAYLTDIKTINEEEIEKLYNLDVLVINALRHEAHPTHFNIDEAIDFVHKVTPMKAYFTHISHLLGFHEEIDQSLPKSIFLAYDELEIEIN